MTDEPSVIRYQRLDKTSHGYYWYEMSFFIRSSLKSKGSAALLIAIIHLTFAIYGMVMTINDVVIQQYPLSTYETTYLLFYYGLHFGMIALLVLGIRKRKPLYYGPWLVSCFAVFAVATYLWIESLANGVRLYATLLNVTILGLGWYGWWTVARKFLSLLLPTKWSDLVTFKSAL